MVRWQREAASPAEKARRHRFEQWLSVYWCSAQAWWEAAEYATMLYPEELEQYRQNNPRPTFKNYLLATKGQPR